MERNDEILAQELGRLGGIGSKWVARKLPNGEYELSAEVNGTAEEVLQYGARVLASQGTLRRDIVESATVPTVAAIVGSGFFNLNPTIVTIEVSARSNEECHVRLYASAKEGLIKQRSAEKAVKRLARQMFPPSV